MKSRKVRNRLATCESQLDQLMATSSKLIERTSYLERRLLNRNRYRWDVIDKVADYFLGAQVAGDYAEFGVYRGETFAYACNTLAPMFPAMRFWALDSFEGLPAPKPSADMFDGYSGGFTKGQFACSQSKFRTYLQKMGVSMSRVNIVPGWYEQTLYPQNPALVQMDKIAFAWIDCDLYESTVPVLEFLTDKLAVGSVILFDDWRCFRNLGDCGQQKACKEWLERHPEIKLNLLIDNDYHGYVFSVAACQT